MRVCHRSRPQRLLGAGRVYEFMVALFNRIVPANGAGLLLCSEPHHARALAQAGDQLGVCLLILS